MLTDADPYLELTFAKVLVDGVLEAQPLVAEEVDEAPRPGALRCFEGPLGLAQIRQQRDECFVDIHLVRDEAVPELLDLDVGTHAFDDADGLEEQVLRLFLTAFPDRESGEPVER